MLSERERNALEQIERDLSADTGFAAAMAGSRRHREQRWRPTWTVGLFVTGSMVTILCAVLGSVPPCGVIR
ncbi:hypothetical protein Psed_6025 [Pseudonocardia dioxanivorans CB1190]|uniref:DUF3040 domain-containing protein n=1 Tax=Pseudonocardia dioxanivorans (strain ATCC 55486 / DSM 44775 / JCM 13855 / CB1190) TaxID=675635 RepID=F4CK33_PSEUX|nr:DUF3040 domain-containing protein [Pseudonocardia dioxanivorans]AEA28139.1 hypothetical protein Psed_6025 [Pseudonocardia dioxanivorans CB1190]